MLGERAKQLSRMGIYLTDDGRLDFKGFRLYIVEYY